MKVIIAGDYCDRFRISDKIKQGQYNELFDDVKPIIGQADYSIVNFEFPILIGEGAPITKCGPNLKGQLKSIDAIKYAGFNVCTLANNHILDQGEHCCIDTINRLNEADIRTVGAGSNLTEAGTILYLHKEGETIGIINCCEHEFTIATETSAGANPLNPVQQYYKILEAKQKADYVLVIVHGGHEHFQLPSPRMKEIYRFFIDAGADAVVNHHQHCFSGYEIYKDNPIFYGLGNFCFDNNSTEHSIWNEGYMVMLEFRNSKISFNIIPYLQNDKNIGVKVLPSNSYKEKLYQLNSIISNKDLLLNKYNEFLHNGTSLFDYIIEPYQGKLFTRLFYKRLVPRFFNQHKKTILQNFVECESHRDKFINYLNECRLKPNS